MSDTSPSPDAPTLRVDLGRFVLVVGDRAGTAIEDAKEDDDAKPHDPDLAAAIARKEPSPKPWDGPEPIGETIENASEVTDRVEHALKLFDEFANERRDLTSLSDEADFLLGLLQRLDRHGRWAEAIDVARALSKLLALLARWKDLLRSLRLALALAKRLDDDDGMAWALHELGTLHLAGGKETTADSMLTEARSIRTERRDRHALQLTEHNLKVLCRTVRTHLHESRSRQFKRIPNAQALALVSALLLIVTGGIAGAVLSDSPKPKPKPKPLIAPLTINFSPASPYAGEQVTFKETAKTTADPYAWWFGDGASSFAAHPKHAYKSEGRYLAVVIATDRHGTILGRGSQWVHVRKKPEPQPPTKLNFRARSSVEGKPVAGERVVFEAIAAPGTALTGYTWHFGDGQTSTDATPVHAYKNPETYEVELIATDSRGSTAKASHTVTVQAAPTPTPKPSTITAACPTRPVELGEPATISGAIKPAPTSATVTITLTAPSGKPTSEHASTEAEGKYAATVTAEEAGEWSASSSWPGNGQYSEATSNTCTFSVVPPG